MCCAGNSNMKSGIHLAAHLPGECSGTDGVALFEGRIIGRVRLLAEGPQDPKPWLWSVTDPDLAGRPGWANTHGERPRAGRPWTARSSAGRNCAGDNPALATKPR